MQVPSSSGRLNASDYKVRCHEATDFYIKKKIKNVCYVFNRKSCAQVNNCLGIASIMTTND